MAKKLYHYCVLAPGGTYRSSTLNWEGDINPKDFYLKICECIREGFKEDFVVLSLTYLGEVE